MEKEEEEGGPSLLSLAVVGTYSHFLLPSFFFCYFFHRHKILDSKASFEVGEKHTELKSGLSSVEGGDGGGGNI